MFSDICLRYTQGHVLAKLHEMALMPFYLSKVNLLIHSAADFIGLSLYNKILSWEKTKHLWKQVAYFSSKEVNCKTADMKDIGHKY